MPRNSGGTYTLPAGNPVVSGTIIASSWANTTMDDLAIEMTDSLSRSGNGAMQAALKHIDGAETSPSQTFNNDPLTGRYLAAVGDMRDTVLGVDKIRLTAAGLEVWIDPDWVPVASTDYGYSKAETDNGRKNYLINGDMSVNQRNWSGAITDSGTDTIDRLRAYINAAAGDTLDVSNPANLSADIEVTKTTHRAAMTFTSSDAVNTNVLFGQLIESGEKVLSGTTVTLSCWFWSDVTRQIATEALIYYGVGGSPDLRGIGEVIDIVAGWQKITSTYEVPALTTETIGANDHLQQAIWLSAGSANDANTQSLGLQPNGTIAMTAWQLESGSVATPFEYVSAGDNLAACQRYYQKNASDVRVPTITATTSDRRVSLMHVVTMRATPSVTGTVNVGALTLTGSPELTDVIVTGAASDTPCSLTGWTADAEL